MREDLKRRILFFTLFLGFFLSCRKVPLTKRSQLALIPDQELYAMSYREYKNYISKAPLSKDPEKIAMVNRVGKRIASAVETYLRENGYEEKLPYYKWEFNVVEEDTINAWCMPGGKVVVYTGILPIAKDDNGLAVVMGHEVAHAVAEHGNERMSQALLVQLGGVALQEALKSKPKETQSIFLGLYGIGAQVGILLPYSRKQESEADYMGLIFMAMAGYHPKHAPLFWERMRKLKKGVSPPEFLSTHPSDERRMKDLEAKIPEALKYYRPH